MFSRHPLHPRLRRWVFSSEQYRSLKSCWKMLGCIDVTTSEFSPQLTSSKVFEFLSECSVWRDAVEVCRAQLRNRESGGCIIEFNPSQKFERAFGAFASFVVAHSTGRVLQENLNTDGLPRESTDFVTIPLNWRPKYSASLLHFDDPNSPWPLHNDRCLHDDIGDYLLVCKVVEKGGAGGDIRLLHVDDIPGLEEVLEDSRAWESLGWKGDERLAPPWRQREAYNAPSVLAPVFERTNHFGLTVRFTDFRFRRPRNSLQAEFLHQLDERLKRHAEDVPAFALPIGGMYLINNRWYLHGRSGFVPKREFRREILRYCGNL